MATKYTNLADKQRKTRARTPDNKPIKGREDEMIENHAGGYSFKTTEMQRLLRFLVIGADKNTYYQTQKVLVKENVDNIGKCLETDPRGTVDLIVDVSLNGRALKQDAGLFALACATAWGVEDPDNQENAETRAYALSKLSAVARTPTALYTFATYVGDLRGWGRGLRRSFSRWYTNKPIDKLAMQAWKYKQRGGFSHRDVLRLAHPITDDLARNKVFEYMTHPDESPLTKGLPKFKNGRVKGFGSEVAEMGFDGEAGIQRSNALNQIAAAEEVLHLTGTDTKVVNRAVKLITGYRLTHEAVPSQLKTNRKVWEALMADMPLQAMVTNLGRLSSVGLLDPLSEGQAKVIEALDSQTAITRSRMHPMRFLIAAKQFGIGQGRSGMSWTPNPKIVDALDEAFYLAFGNVVPTGKRILVAIDDSGSMQGGWYSSAGVMGISGFSPAEAACAMGLVLYKTEPNCHMIGYSTDVREWKNLSKKLRIDNLQSLVGGGGGTYTALPLHYVLERNLDVDGIVSFTDNETWAGGGGWGYASSRSGKIAELLPQYARKVGHPVRFINAAVLATNCTDVDPNNKDMFEIAGFDARVPSLVGEFLGGGV